MLFQNLLIAFSLSAMSLAQNNNNNNNNNNDDVPRQCQQVCSNVASNENRCDAENGRESPLPKVLLVAISDTFFYVQTTTAKGT
jgi:hypothetical protein